MEATIKIAREKLYDQVWSKPLIHLAKEYTISDRGLAKICRRHNIPLPPAGYWLRVAHGQTVKKIPIPPLKEGEADTIEIVSKTTSPLDDKDLNGTPNDPIIKAIGHSFIRLIEFKKEFHPLLVESQKEFPERLKDYKKAPEGERFNAHNISVTKSSFERALSLMNMLFQVLEVNGLPISRIPGYHGGTHVKICGIDVQIALKERTKRTENPDPKFYSKYDFHPTGVLCFEIENIYVDGARKTWNDTQSRKLEEVINEVGIGIVVAAILRKKRDQEWEEKEQQEQVERERRRLREQQLKREQESVESLFEDARKWDVSNTVREYVKAVEKAHSSEGIPSEIKTELEEWVNWAREKADIIDPVLNESWKKNSL